MLLNSPSNPTGAVYREDEIRAVVEICRRRNVVLISDEIYDRFCFDAPLGKGHKRPAHGHVALFRNAPDFT